MLAGLHERQLLHHDRSLGKLAVLLVIAKVVQFDVNAVKFGKRRFSTVQPVGRNRRPDKHPLR